MNEAMKRDLPHHSISGVFVFLLLGVFAVMSTLMVLMGAQLYRDVVDETEAHNEMRVRTSYLINTVRGNDSAGAVYTEQLDGIDMLTFRMGEGDDCYLTRVYCYDGALCERFAAADEEFKPEYGERVAEAAAFAASVQDGMVTIRMLDADGQEQELSIALRCPQEVE